MPNLLNRCNSKQLEEDDDDDVFGINNIETLREESPRLPSTETFEYVTNDREYQHNGKIPGKVIIFNQKIFDSTDFKKRTGTVFDINALIQTFGSFGFKITQEDIHRDLTRVEILAKLKEIADESHSQRSCLIIIMMTHGYQGNALQAKDAPIYANEIWEQFAPSKCPSLENKPKLFIFQACKGSKTSRPSTSSAASNSSESPTNSDLVSSNFFTKPLEPDMLIAFASVEGNEAFKHIFDGSWFIQELCQNFAIHGHMDDVQSLLIRTAKCVAHNYYNVFTENATNAATTKIIKQMPIFVSTLTKRFYLNRSSDRNRLMHMLQQQRKIAELVTTIQSEIEKL